jgi:hypothetical protein
MSDNIKDIIKFLAKRGGTLDFDVGVFHVGISSKDGGFHSATKKTVEKNLFGDITTAFREARKKAGI